MFFVAPVRFRSAMSAGARAAIVLGALLAQLELINQDPGCPIVLNVRRGPFLLRVLPYLAQVATLGLSLPSVPMCVHSAPQASSPLDTDAPHQTVDVRAVLLERFRQEVA